MSLLLIFIGNLFFAIIPYMVVWRGNARMPIKGKIILTLPMMVLLLLIDSTAILANVSTFFR